MTTVDTTGWAEIERGDTDASGKMYSRLNLLFSRDPFVQMLDPALRQQLTIALVSKATWLYPHLAKRAMEVMPYSTLWSSAFVEHVIALVHVASAIKEEED